MVEWHAGSGASIAPFNPGVSVHNYLYEWT